MRLKHVADQKGEKAAAELWEVEMLERQAMHRLERDSLVVSLENAVASPDAGRFASIMRVAVNYIKKLG